MRGIPKTLQLLVVLVFCFTTLAFAEDGTGVKLISQGSVMAAGGFPYKIAQPGSYKLSSNLIVPANVIGIVISADNVTLELNGFSIIGQQGSGSVGIYGGYSDDVTVLNGSVVGMGGNGVSLYGNGILVEKVHAKLNNTGIYLTGSGVVRDCTAVSNSHGFAVTGFVVEGNSASFNGIGFDVVGSTMIANTAYRNTYGLAAWNSVYGSNTFYQNSGGDLLSSINATFQNNNNCSGTTC